MRPRVFLAWLICFAIFLLAPAGAVPEKPLSVLSSRCGDVRKKRGDFSDRMDRIGKAPYIMLFCQKNAALPKGKSPRIGFRALSAAKALKTSDGRDVDVVWSASTGTPVKLKGPLGEKTGEEPSRVARGFLKKHYRLLSLKSDLSDLSLPRVSESSAGYHVTFQQLCRGIPVEGAKVKVHLFRDRRIQMVKSRLSRDLRPETDPRISSEQAIDISRRHLQLTGDLRGPILAEKVVLPEPSPGALAWKVSIPARKPCGDWVVMVHAREGEVLSATDIRMFASGQGKVFDPNPVVTLQTTSLSDQNDSAEAVPENAYSSVTLENLDNTGYLRGPYVDTGLTSPRAFSEELDFRYDRSQPGFEEVMIYYHVQEFQKYLQDELGAFLGTRQVLADAHATEEDNSYFSPLIRAIYFGDGGVDDGEDAHLVLHEYVHAVTYDVLRDTSQNQEASAMSEGTSDYFAASFFAHHGFMPETFAQWDGISNTPIGVRRVDSTKVYPADMVGESHDDGEIWSSALWHLREAVGREVADSLLAQSIYYLDGSSLFSDGLEALFLADDALYGGEHADAISVAFAARGILLQSLMNLGETRNGMLAKGDLTMLDGSYYDQYSFAASSGQVVKIALTSGDFDTYLVLADPFFNTLAYGDDLADGSTDSRIILTIPYSGTYHILANAYAENDTGQYSLSLSTGSLPEGTPQSTSIAFGREVSGYLGGGDLSLSDGTHYDEYLFAGHVGQQITISMTSLSYSMDAYLVLYDAELSIIAEDDDSGPGTDALLTYTLLYDGDYSVAANQAELSSGGYTLLLTSSDPPLQLAGIVSGALEVGDLTMTADGSYFDAYQFEGTPGQTFSYKMYSTDFDPYLIVYNPYFNTIIEVDDASADNTNAVFEEFELRIPGTYFVIANAYEAGQTGAYKLAVCPLSITDTDSDGYSDRTEIAESTNPLDASSVPPDFDGDFIPDSMDPDDDNDGMLDIAELVAGTDPHDPTSFLRVLAVSLPAEGLTVEWSSSPGHHYAVYRSTDLLDWTLAESHVASQGAVTTWTETDHAGEGALFYRIEALPLNP